MLWIRYSLLVSPLLAKTVTLHQTNTHTIQEVQTEVHTTLITRWSTIQHTDEPTTTTTITRTTTTTIDIDPSSSPSSFPSQVVDLHNYERSKHSAQPLTWSSELTNFAESYATNYNCNGTLIHSHSKYGENLALGYNTSAAIKAWYDEVKLYDFNNPGFRESTGHFTQLVWNSTKYIGCAVKDCGSYFGQYLVCEYDPPGNFQGAFDDNVFAG
ncbi:hypothetical protein WICANDRAFT_90751 [Wickerhamomyces anomalus NRRL Y-366-8]|uniref:SCP domain-containing protein n=1 Tax=Wickerhamomyces anomalus (strain ATCC 58044 / CBS 1984 / NCYC 433 / NRRL Y-366-8) TaxID=683960 RepID=A0A1E3P7F3_WICAA|nr:uncharacterized protein WICANDRAFT_90751 [Wickerhamomyces anomalus NRRL Y-366-8]ODQ61345.1 hypothetical protein WICANDRAFT_90751 [Wickerhamomyces anomalus NRRL Y-366-8]